MQRHSISGRNRSPAWYAGSKCAGAANYRVTRLVEPSRNWRALLIASGVTTALNLGVLMVADSVGWLGGIAFRPSVAERTLIYGPAILCFIALPLAIYRWLRAMSECVAVVTYLAMVAAFSLVSIQWTNDLSQMQPSCSAAVTTWNSTSLGAARNTCLPWRFTSDYAVCSEELQSPDFSSANRRELPANPMKANLPFSSDSAELSDLRRQDHCLLARSCQLCYPEIAGKIVRRSSGHSDRNQVARVGMRNFDRVRFFGPVVDSMFKGGPAGTEISGCQFILRRHGPSRM